MDESFSDQRSRRRPVVVSAAVAICLLGILLYLPTSRRGLKNRNAPSGARIVILRAAADAPANRATGAVQLAPAPTTISRHGSPNNRTQRYPARPVGPPVVLTLGNHVPSQRRSFSLPIASDKSPAAGTAAPKTGAARTKTMPSVEAFSKPPLNFEANVGQVEQIPGEAALGKGRVRFLSHG